MVDAWYRLSNEGEVFSPALVIYPERAAENVRRLIRMAGSPDRLRPHVKTHKIAELMRPHLAEGIRKFKCATVAEAEMAAGCGAPDVLLAYQPVGPTVRRLVELTERYPTTAFSVIADDDGAVRALSSAFVAVGRRIPVLIDLDVGQHRTGIAAGPEAVALYRTVSGLAGLEPGGLHAYDGHIHMTDVAERERACEAAFAPVAALRRELIAAGLPVPRVVTSGTPTFPFHIRRADVECSPGTTVLWDYGYATEFPDLEFLIAAAVLTRVTSKPGPGRLCLDLGHKAVASEMPHPRVFLPDLPDARFVAHNEEHLVIETEEAARFRVGDVLYGWPTHICPTVNLHSEVWVAVEGRARECWPVTARARRLTV